MQWCAIALDRTHTDRLGNGDVTDGSAAWSTFSHFASSTDGPRFIWPGQNSV